MPCALPRDAMESARSADGVEQLYRESRTALLAYFGRRHRSRTSVEDLLQETFLRLLRRVDRLREARSPRAYLFGIARHVSVEAWRRAAPASVPAAESAVASAPEPDPRVAAVREVIARLPPLQREILDLRFQHDLSYAEMAEALDIPVGTVRSRLHNAMQVLRDAVAREESGPSEGNLP